MSIRAKMAETKTNSRSSLLEDNDPEGVAFEYEVME